MSTEPVLVPTAGRARVDRRTKRLLERIQAGEIAIIDHEDLDRIAAENLVRARPAAVVNAAACISGRYPNVGPLLIAAAGIPLVDCAGTELLDRVHDGQLIRVEGDEVWLNGELVAKGARQSLGTLEAEYEAAKGSLGEELERFAENTLEYMRRERHFVVEPPDFPDAGVTFRHRHALVVVRGADYRSDLAHLRSYVNEMKPVLVAVDGGADALLDVGFTPDLIIGDFDSVSTQALHTGAKLAVHAYAGGNAPGAARLDQLGLEYVTIEAPGTSEDVAMLLAYELGAELIVAVGTHASMVDFLDKGRAGMASTFLVRLKVGPILVDAKGVSRLYQGRIRKRDMTFFLVAAVFALLAIVVFAVPRVFVHSFWLILSDFWHSITH
ncbi:MAG TPA: putative cytokinetic ring protein SteA [Acidimicrobiales bacterium]|nr:putative cytokinetic ring protein SteA [Acidimicrobiales bacterium]